MTKVDIKLITRVITIICGGLIITLGILRFINMNYTLSKTHYILMTINLMYNMNNILQKDSCDHPCAFRIPNKILDY